MKQLKFSTALVAVLLCSNLLFAGKPKPETANDISSTMVEFVHKEVNLTPTQKEVLKKKANDYANKLMQARAMADTVASYIFMKTESEKYEAAMDSILTPDQKVVRVKKQKERLDFITNIGNKK